MCIVCSCTDIHKNISLHEYDCRWHLISLSTNEKLKTKTKSLPYSHLTHNITFVSTVITFHSLSFSRTLGNQFIHSHL